MTGVEFKQEMRRRRVKPERLALDLEVTAAAVHKWFALQSPLPRRTLLALKALGYISTVDSADKNPNAK